MKEFKIVIRYGRYEHEYEAILYVKQHVFGLHYWLRVDFLRDDLLTICKQVLIWQDVFNISPENIFDETILCQRTDI